MRFILTCITARVINDIEFGEVFLGQQPGALVQNDQDQRIQFLERSERVLTERVEELERWVADRGAAPWLLRGPPLPLP